MKTTFADVEPNPAIVCVVGPAAVVTFPFNSRQAAVGGAVLAPGGGFLARAPCPSYNPNPNTSIVFLLGVGLAWYVVQWLAQRMRCVICSLLLSIWIILCKVHLILKAPILELS